MIGKHSSGESNPIFGICSLLVGGNINPLIVRANIILSGYFLYYMNWVYVREWVEPSNTAI